MAKIDPFNSNPEVSYAITTPPIIVKIIPNISSFLNLSFNKAAPKITEKTTWNFIKKEVTGGPTDRNAITQKATPKTVIIEEIIITSLYLESSLMGTLTWFQRP